MMWETMDATRTTVEFHGAGEEIGADEVPAGMVGISFGCDSIAVLLGSEAEIATVLREALRLVEASGR
jgi:hypothetical protein